MNLTLETDGFDIQYIKKEAINVYTSFLHNLHKMAVRAIWDEMVDSWSPWVFRWAFDGQSLLIYNMKEGKNGLLVPG